MPEAAVPICDAVARDLLPHMQNLVALGVQIRVDCYGNSFPLSTDLARAIGSLQQLAKISFSGCHLPLIPDLRLDHVVHMQTNKTISSFDPFSALRELRNDQSHWLDTEGYRIPVEAFARLEVLHFCQSNSVAQMQWFIEDCKVSSCRAVMEVRAQVEPRLIPMWQAVRQYLSSSSKPSLLRELVLRSNMTSPDLREVISSLASPSIRIFVSYGIYGNTDEYDDLLKLAIDAFPNAAIEFVDVRIPQDTPHEH